MFGRTIPNRPRRAPGTAPVRTVSTDNDRVEKILIDTLQLISKNIEELREEIENLKQNQSETGVNVKEFASRQKQLESEFSNMLSKFAASEAASDKAGNIAEAPSQSAASGDEAVHEAVNPSQNHEVHRSSYKRLMPGVGFSSITPEYLKSLKNI